MLAGSGRESENAHLHQYNITITIISPLSTNATTASPSYPAYHHLTQLYNHSVLGNTRQRTGVCELSLNNEVELFELGLVRIVVMMIMMIVMIMMMIICVPS